MLSVTTNGAICSRSRNTSRAASRRRKSCWKNSGVRGVEASTQCSKSTPTERDQKKRDARNLALPFLIDQVSRLGIERPDLARRFAQRFLCHLRAQKIDTSRDPLGLLQGEPIEITTAYELLHVRSALRIELKRLEGLAAKCQGRLVGLAQLELNAFAEQLQGVATVIGAYVKFRAGKFGVNKIDDAAGRFPVVNADGDEPHLDRSGGAQHVEAGAIAVIDLEAEPCCLLDHQRIVVDRGDIDSFGQQTL